MAKVLSAVPVPVITVSTDPPVVSHEYKRAGLVMPEGYKRSVAAWFARLNGQAVP